MALEQQLDNKLLGEFAKAQERTQRGKLAIGVPDAPQDEKIGFTPRAIRMGKSLIAEKELADLDKVFKDSMREYERTANFKDIQTRNRSMIDMKKRFAKVRDTLFTQGLAFQKKIHQEKLDAQSEALLWEQLGSVAQSLGKIYVLNSLKTPGTEVGPIEAGGIRTGQGTVLPGDYGGTTPATQFRDIYNVPTGDQPTAEPSGLMKLFQSLGID